MEATLKTLNKLLVGDRFWFWFCTKVEAGQPTILVTPYGDDPDMANLKKAAEGVAVRIGGIPMTGLGNVANDGHLQLSCTLASDAALNSLAAWVSSNVGEHADLARFKHTEMINVSAQGVVRSMHSNAKLWSSVPDVNFRGSPGEMAKRLSGLTTKDSYWFWLGEFGPGDAPYLHLVAVERDPEGSSFVRQMVRLKSRASRQGTELRGIVQKSEGNTVVFVTEDNVESGPTILKSLAGATEALRAALQNTMLIQKSGKTISKVINTFEEGNESASTRSVESVDLSVQISALKKLVDPGNKTMFWMGRVGGATHLLLSESKEDLKKSIMGIGSAEQSARGQVVVSSKGWLEFRTRNSYPGFIDQLIDWTCGHHNDWPGLSRLQGSRMTQTDGDKNIIDRQKNSDGWQRLN